MPTIWTGHRHIGFRYTDESGQKKTYDILLTELRTKRGQLHLYGYSDQHGRNLLFLADNIDGDLIDHATGQHITPEDINTGQEDITDSAQPAAHQDQVDAYVALHRKSPWAAFILALLFGPLGMLYASVPGAIIVFVLLLVTYTIPVLPIIIWLLGLLWAPAAIHTHNDKVRANATILLR